MGSILIKHAHKRANELGYNSIVLLGHKNYYPRFGYKQAVKFHIEFPFNAPKENCMAIELTKNGLDGVNGLVEYPKEFFE
ncbi:GNAT family N-acetyltransferase [Xanthomarina spongicola]|uniref:GNAT family N-acetyltransferase n=1 Tax=Xanthomarina spongicola TaxID=570520 RepID=UPI00319E8374